MGGQRRKNPGIIYDVLASSDRPLTAYQILERVRDHGLKGPPTVYRALEMLQNQGLVHRLQSINAFVVCHRHASEQTGSSFMICKSCGITAEFHDKRMERVLSEWKDRAHFSVSRQTVELVGTCQACQDAKFEIPSPK